MAQIQFTIALVLIGLFTVALIGFATNFATDNAAPVDLAEDPSIASLDANVQSNISQIRSQSESTYQSIITSSISSESGTAQSIGPFAITSKNSVGVAKNVVEVGYLRIFGTGAGFGIFLYSFLGIITFIVILYVWKTFKGVPD